MPRQTYMVIPLEKKVDTLFSFLRWCLSSTPLNRRAGRVYCLRFAFAEEDHCLCIHLQASPAGPPRVRFFSAAPITRIAVCGTRKVPLVIAGLVIWGLIDLPWAPADDDG